MAYAHKSAPRAGKDAAKRGVTVVIRARPTSHFAHGSLNLSPDTNAVDLKLDGGDELVNNQTTGFSFKYNRVRVPHSCCPASDDCD